METQDTPLLGFNTSRYVMFRGQDLQRDAFVHTSDDSSESIMNGGFITLDRSFLLKYLQRAI